jgi:ATP-dependent Clp protease ATP-binding subunit ClpA
VFERFTDRARRVVVLAQDEARMLGHGYIGTEHILLGLIQEGAGIAAQALESLGISLAAVRLRVQEIIGAGVAAPPGHIPFTPRAKKVLEFSLREAMQLGHDYIGTEHILLGLIREGDGVAAQVLQKLGADLDRVRATVIELLSASPRAEGGRSRGELIPWRLRFSSAAAEIVRLAHSSALDRGHELIEPTDLLTGLVVSDDPSVVEALRSWGIDLARVRERIEELATKEEENEGGDGGAEP